MIHLLQKFNRYVMFFIRKGIAFALTDIKGRSLKLWDARIGVNDLYRRLTVQTLSYGVIGVEDQHPTLRQILIKPDALAVFDQIVGCRAQWDPDHLSPCILTARIILDKPQVCKGKGRDTISWPSSTTKRKDWSRVLRSFLLHGCILQESSIFTLPQLS